MKIQQRLCLPGTRFARRRGFALIATLTLMMLLAMIATALMATAASQNRIAMQTVLQAEARQQALIGLDAAIGELQAQLGADQRVSACSGVCSENESGTPQHLLGVWDSWDGPIYGSGRTSKSKSKIQETYTQGRASQFRKWLISSRNDRETRDFNAAKSLCSRRPGQRICMVGAGTLGRALDNTHWVYADLLSMPSTGKNQACFAWWVGGENQKAKLSVEDPEESKDPIEVLHRTWNTPAPMVVDNRDLDFVPSRVENAAKLTTLNSLPLLDSSSQPAGTPYFFDVTTSSYSLPINVSMGGLKQDLCLLLNKETLKGTEFAARADQDCPLVQGNDVPVGTESNMPIGSWQTLYAYYNCWPNGEAGAEDFTARLPGSLKDPYTRMSGAAYTQNGLEYFREANEAVSDVPNSVFDARSMMDSGSKSAGYARTPIMLAYMCNLGLDVEKGDQKTDDQGNEIPTYSLNFTFAPMFLYWNPYNVPMRVKSRRLWTKTTPYKLLNLEFNNLVTKDGRSNWLSTGWKTGNPARKNVGSYTRDKLYADYGQCLQNSLNDNSDIVFRPGEVLFFSLASGKGSSEAWRTPLVLQFWPDVVSSYKARMYSNCNEQLTNEGYFDVNLGADEYITDGYYFSRGHAECITIQHGFGGRRDNPDSDNNWVDQSKFFAIQSPQRHILNWFAPGELAPEQRMVCSRQLNDSTWDTSMVEDDQPYFVCAVGVVAKSANTQVEEYLYGDSDYRGKLWQHATPATWGGALLAPTDQERQYHPYQLATLKISGGLATAPMDNIGNNGYLGITSDGEQVSFASVSELPVHPPFSLAGLAGMRLTPGWYAASWNGDIGSSVVGAIRRSAYIGGVPGVGIGNAFADPTIPADGVYAFHRTQTSQGLNDMNGGASVPSNKQIYGDYFDHGLLINDAMWDRWFMSSVSDMPTGDNIRKAQEVLSDFLSGKEALPVARYKKCATPYNDEQVINRLMSGDGWKYIAQYLMIDGGFNVNSTSVEAWTAVLQGLARRKLVTGDGNRLSLVEENKSEQQVLFSRFMYSTTDKSVDSLGGYSMMQGSSRFRNSGMLNAWGEVRMLEPESIRRLAEEMVKQVRKRGPFLSMSDFVNRRLTQGETGLKGALQAAIDATDINRDFQDVIVQPRNNGDLYANPDAEKGSMYTAAPGYLIQSDVLMSLGNILTVRDDTFTVRAYGCVKSASNAILAQAWCEAVVQRTMNYVDPTNDPADAEYNPDGTKGKGLTKLNRVLGRRFQVVSFKWLDVWDI